MENKMRILVFNTLYVPDLGPSAPLFTSLCEELVRIGNQVTVVVTVPHFPTGQVSEPFRGKLFWQSIENGVNVIRVGLPSMDRSRLPQRFLQFICYQLGTTWKILGQKYDVVLAGSPSLSGWLPFAVAVAARRKPAVYSVQDLYPNVGITQGIFRNKFVIAVVTALEKFCFNHAAVVQIISESFRTGLHDLGVPDAKIALLYNWIDTDAVHPLPRSNEFSKEHGLEERFVVLYAGNIGPSQGLESVLDAAEKLQNHKDIIFVLIGDGLNRKSLVAETEKRALKNVTFLPFQPRERLSEIMASANLSLVPLRKGIDKGSLPSKLLTVLASGRPVLACVEEDSEMWKLVERGNAGIRVPPEDPEELCKAILALKENEEKCQRLGQNGRDWAEKNHSPRPAAKAMEELLSQAMNAKKSR
jgi:colanic acid biosynthesis glycosyl transferase WcaI